MKFRELAEYLEQIEKTASRNEMTVQLAALFKKVDAESTAEMLYLLQGRLSPLFEREDFGIAEKMVVEAAAAAFNIDPKQFRQKNRSLGDVGEAAEYFRSESKIPHKNLTIRDAFSSLKAIAKFGGTGSQEQKLSAMGKLICNLDPLSVRFVVRIPLGKLRLGFSDMTVLDSYSWMLSGDKSLRPEIEKAYHVNPDIGMIGQILKTKGIAGLKNVKPEVFRPIIMMRAERLSEPAEILEKAPSGIIEPKFDGFRLQIHCKKTRNSKLPSASLPLRREASRAGETRNPNQTEIKLYSRNLEEVSYMYPDIVAGVKEEVKAETIIFEGEAIGFDPHSGSFLPFQETVQRKRKYGIEDKAKEIPLKLFAFDILYLDGENHLKTPFEKRRKLLEKAINITGDVFADTLMLAPEQIAKNEHEIELAFETAIAEGLEGIMIKRIDGIYQPGARGWNWIKYKRSYASKIDDTIDCLVMGYDLGRGKRNQFGIGAFLAGIYDEKKDLFVTVGKIGTGLTDEEWREMKRRCDQVKAKEKPPSYEVDKMMFVDVWAEAKTVVEIRADELTRSSVHTAGRVMKASKSGKAMAVDIPGFALRFPRLERFRDDKDPNDITTLSEVEKMFKKQKH